MDEARSWGEPHRERCSDKGGHKVTPRGSVLVALSFVTVSHFRHLLFYISDEAELGSDQSGRPVLLGGVKIRAVELYQSRASGL